MQANQGEGPMRSSLNLIYQLLHKDYPESFSTYAPQTKDFYDMVYSQLPESWSIQRGDMWFYCCPPAYAPPSQGWKIHVSATRENCRYILDSITSVLVKHHDASFKFALDRSLLSLLNSKRWPRAASGKFITIYPQDSHRFLELIEEVDQATSGMQGPYILSDHRYKDSRVVFYRYGGVRAQTALTVKGEKIPILRAPDDTVIPDQRFAYPVVPAWEKPVLPVASDKNENSDSISLLHGRYIVDTAVTFSNAGGVYYASDTKTGKKVVIKEARPHINAMTDGYDAVEMLKKEYRLLGVVADTGIAPQPLDLFQEWEHWFLVEEFITGTPMSRHSAAHNILLRTRPTGREIDEWYAKFARLCCDLTRILSILHDRKIVFADLSTNNLIVAPDGETLKIIDFEGAHQLGVDRPANIFTPGFVSQHRANGGQARWEDDYYAAGAVLLAYLLPINGLLHLNPQTRRDFLAAIRDDIHLPASIADLINSLMDHPGLSSLALDSTVERSPSLPRKLRGSACPSHDYQAVLDDIVKHLHGIADYGRNDRLYPADPRVFSTNPLSLAYGAAGVAYAVHKITGNVPPSVVEWILQHQVTPSDYPPGLYVGTSGIAWSLLEIGMKERAEEVFQSTVAHPLVYHSADLFHGMAGWGMTGLRFFHTTEKEHYLQQAREAGDRLLASCQESERGYCWPTSEQCSLGLAHGSSGIALFLLYLYLATENERYLTGGVQALDFDLNSAVRTQDGGLSWGEAVELSSPLYPYWRFGSAGVGIVTARFQRLVASPRYQSILEQIFIDTDRKYAVFPGRFTGLVGLGEFLLDMHDLSGEDRFLKSAKRVAEGIMHFRVERNGSAFPGELLSRLCCDYGTGSAGIALFLNRLLGNQKSDFMLDGLFEKYARKRVENVKSPSNFQQRASA
jgi:serine/threonine protein kinase